MGRHRSAPASGNRYLVATATVAALLAGVGAVGNAIWHRIEAHPDGSRPRQTTMPPTSPPSLRLVVTGERCHVVVRVPGGDVLLAQTLTHGQTVQFRDPRLDAVVSDAGAVQVTIDGTTQPPGSAGERVTFHVPVTGTR